MMKVTVNVECTPEEARTFLGLPDLQPMQQALLQEMQEHLSSGMRAMTPESLMRNWVPMGMQGAEQVQKMFWEQVQKTFAGVTNAATTAMVTFKDK